MIKHIRVINSALKADVSQLTELVTTDYLTTKHTSSVDLSTGYYKKTHW